MLQSGNARRGCLPLLRTKEPGVGFGGLRFRVEDLGFAVRILSNSFKGVMGVYRDVYGFSVVPGRLDYKGP